MSRRPLAVLISDIHFSVPTLELASASLRMARDRATALGVPLILAGDTLDSKAIIRGECANRLIEIFTESGQAPQTYVLVGNHDLINEKGKEHSLNFLKPYVTVVEGPLQTDIGWLIPYQTHPEAMSGCLESIPKGSLIVIHQGLQGADLGHYVQDKTALPKEAFADFRVISGHYHRAQDIKCGRPRSGAVGLFSYIGNPYSLTFGEANDGPKGFQILYSDGLMEQVPTNLRRHWILERTCEEVMAMSALEPAQGDLVWLKVKGPSLELAKLNKAELGRALFGHSSFKLDKIPSDTPKLQDGKTERMTDAEVLDAVIEGTDEPVETKAELKALWRELLQ